MATAILNPVIDSISGSVGDLVFYKRYGRTVMRAWIMPPNPRTPAQQSNRSRFREAMTSWRALPDYEKDSYNRRARKFSMTGHNLYISRYMKGMIGQERKYPGTDEGVPAGFALSNEAAPVKMAPGKFALSKKFAAGNDIALSNASAAGEIALSSQSAGKTAPARRFALSNHVALSNDVSPLHEAFPSVTAPSMVSATAMARGFPVH